MNRPLPPRRLVAGVAVAAAVAGTAVALYYQQLGIALTHYDARGHLIVGRRIFDSITPGWQQIGAVWLPLPHLLNAIPVQNDFLYRTGASAIAISVASFAIAAASIAWLVYLLTGSTVAAIAGTLVFVLNPNVLYLQATPMTEPLLMATCTLSVAMLVRSVSASPALSAPAAGPIGIAFALACLTRYEAWPVTAAAIALAAIALTDNDRLRCIGALALYPLIAIAGFTIFSRVVVGEWFVGGDFFVPENKSFGDWWLAIKEIAWGTAALSSSVLVWIAGAGLIAGLIAATVGRVHRAAVIVLALGATAAIPLVAFHKGHPFRIRYMVPLIAIEAVGCGLAVSAVRRFRIPAALVVMAIAATTLRPLDSHAPMVLEAQWDAPNLPVRAAVTACLKGWQPGQKIMASMGSLGHYMQEAAADGFRIRDFLHEGNGDIWLDAIEHPRPYADWILIEEKAEGGDLLARIVRERPAFLEGYSRVCDGAGLALYRRVN